jgi:hypothetical protein
VEWFIQVYTFIEITNFNFKKITSFCFWLIKGDGFFVRCFHCSTTFEGIQDEFSIYEKHLIYANNQCQFIKQILKIPDDQYIRTIRDMEQSKQPLNPMYESKEKRLQSFANWPEKLSKMQIDLAKTGFHYVGGDDLTVKCFSCKVNINGWSPEHDPKLIHKKVQPNCKFLKHLEEVDEANEKMEYKRKSMADLRHSSATKNNNNNNEISNQLKSKNQLKEEETATNAKKSETTNKQRHMSTS